MYMAGIIFGLLALYTLIVVAAVDSAALLDQRDRPSRSVNACVARLHTAAMFEAIVAIISFVIYAVT